MGSRNAAYLGKYCENNVQLRWRCERVALIKGWSEFIGKAEMSADKMCVFTPIDGGFDFNFYKKGTSVEIIWSCKKHRQGPWADPRYEGHS
jgi:hypothetical protein